MTQVSYRDMPLEKISSIELIKQYRLKMVLLGLLLMIIGFSLFFLLFLALIGLIIFVIGVVPLSTLTLIGPNTKWILFIRKSSNLEDIKSFIRTVYYKKDNMEYTSQEVVNSPVSSTLYTSQASTHNTPQESVPNISYSALSNMPECSNCGKVIPSGSTFCPSCGYFHNS